MTISLPADVLGELPSPDAQGLVRATVALKINQDGKSVDLVELNDHPLPTGDADEDEKSDSDVLAAYQPPPVSPEF